MLEWFFWSLDDKHLISQKCEANVTWPTQCQIMTLVVKETDLILCKHKQQQQWKLNVWQAGCNLTKTLFTSFVKASVLQKSFISMQHPSGKAFQVRDVSAKPVKGRDPTQSSQQSSNGGNCIRCEKPNANSRLGHLHRLDCVSHICRLN